jgi:serine protease Do
MRIIAMRLARVAGALRLLFVIASGVYLPSSTAAANPPLDVSSPSRSMTMQAAPPLVAANAGRLGLSVSDLKPQQRKKLGVTFGLVVERIDPAARAPQLNPGDVIVAIGNEEFGSTAQFNRIVSRLKPGDSVPLLVRRGDAASYIPVVVQP